MQVRASDWKLVIEELWSAPAFDYPEAARLLAEMAQQNKESDLQHAASQALPSLRAACAEGADRGSRELAQRRFGAVRDVLHALTAPRFGRRRGDVEALTPDDFHRQMLALPPGRRLFGAEIHQAYKHAAKKVHPDVGGSEKAFQELTAARDALMKAI